MRGLDGADLGDGDLPFGEDLEEKGLELFVRTVDLVDQQHRRRLLRDRLQQRPAQEERLREDLVLLLLGGVGGALVQLDANRSLFLQQNRSKRYALRLVDWRPD